MPTLRVERLDDRITPTTLPTGFGESQFGGPLNRPTAFAVADDGRVFVAQQGGTLRVLAADGSTPATPALSLTVDSGGERGLLGVALAPDFASSGNVYVYYTVPAANGNAPFNRVSRFTLGGNTLGNERVVVNLDPLSGATNHNGGAIHFAPDGTLFVATGENANPQQSQLLTNRFGKILRYNADGSVPADNPTAFAGLSGSPAGANRAIWAVGLRNPFTFAVAGDGSLVLNDVGQNTTEEVNPGGPGRNYGWPATEGDFDPAAFPNFTRPLTTYAHGGGTDKGFAVAGAAFYDGGTFPAAYSGDYFYGDFVNGWIRSFDRATATPTLFATALTTGGLVDLATTPAGDLLYLARGDGSAAAGRVYRIRFTDAPQISQQPADATTQPGRDVSFAVTATGTPAPTYQWQRNGTDIPGATVATYTLTNPQLGDTGATFRVVVSNEAGSVTSSSATLTVTTNQPPVPTIDAPTAGTTFAGGQAFAFAGRGTDPEDGPLAATALTWRVDYITGSAAPRPFVPDTVGASGTLTIPTVTPYTLTDVLYRVVLTARDAAGNATTVTRDLAPRLSSITLMTNPAGVALTIDGQPAPATAVPSVVGVERQFSAPATATVNGKSVAFAGWADGVATTVRTVQTPATAGAYTAVYREVTTPPVPQVPPPVAPPPPVVVGPGPGGDGVIRVQVNGGTSVVRLDLNQVTLPGGSRFSGEVRVAVGDVTGDGVKDVVAASGPGRAGVVVVYEGTSLTGTPAVVTAPAFFEASFTGGLFVSVGDIDGDGAGDLIVSPDQGGGPRVMVYSVKKNGAVLADFFGIDDPNFRGGARTAAADVTGDLRDDVLVAAGFGGGPRVAGFDGRILAAGALQRAFADFFVFEQTLRNGVYVAAGDISGDGRADVVFGGGPGGGPRVFALSGRPLVGDIQTVVANFFAGDAASRDGVRVGVTSGRIVAGLADRAIVFDPSGTPIVTFDAEDGLTGGVFVG